MKFAKRLAALLLAALLAASLTACDIKTTAQNMILGAATAMGIRQEDDGEQTDTDIRATAGGSVTFPEGMDQTARLSTQVQDGSLYIAFNGIANRSTSYFVAAGDSLTITSYATTESTGLLEYKCALWELADDQTSTSYVVGSTVYYTTGGDCYTYTVTGLTPGKKYKAVISYDSGSYFITGGMVINGLAGSELTDVKGDTDSGN